MTLQYQKRSDWIWPIAFMLVGVFCISKFFYSSSFLLQDALKGVGFLLMVPSSLLHPSEPTSDTEICDIQPRRWTTWLGVVGLSFVITGFILQWL